MQIVHFSEIALIVCLNLWLIYVCCRLQFGHLKKCKKFKLQMYVDS